MKSQIIMHSIQKGYSQKWRSIRATRRGSKSKRNMQQEFEQDDSKVVNTSDTTWKIILSEMLATEQDDAGKSSWQDHLIQIAWTTLNKNTGTGKSQSVEFTCSVQQQALLPVQNPGSVMSGCFAPWVVSFLGGCHSQLYILLLALYCRCQNLPCKNIHKSLETLPKEQMYSV